jgi:hypothetical protein
MLEGADPLINRYPTWDDWISPQVVNAAMRVEAEIALHANILDPWHGLESLTETLACSVNIEDFKAIFHDAQRRMAHAEQELVQRARVTSKPVALHIPHMIEAHEVARALNLTSMRKAFIWNDSLKIRVISPMFDTTRVGYATSPFTLEQHREHRDLAQRYNRKPETVADWRRKVPQAFAARVAEMERRLLPPEVIQQHQRQNEHPMETSMRLRRMEKNRQRQRAGKNLTRTEDARVEAYVEGVSERTVWRWRAEQKDLRPKTASRFVSENVTIGGDNSHVSRGFYPVVSSEATMLVTDSKDLNATRRRYSRLQPDTREDLKKWYLRRTGRPLTDATIRQWRHRGLLEAKIIAMLDDFWGASVELGWEPPST